MEWGSRVLVAHITPVIARIESISLSGKAISSPFLTPHPALDTIMKSPLSLILLLITAGIALYAIGSYMVSTSYPTYLGLYEYRRLHPDILPSAKSLQISTSGHATTYADILWIDLIQYIGDNIGNGKYTTFTNTLADTITDLHPHFSKPYVLALLLSPHIDEATSTGSSAWKGAEAALAVGEK
jgi:hypothetical protein